MVLPMSKESILTSNIIAFEPQVIQNVTFKVLKVYSHRYIADWYYCMFNTTAFNTLLSWCFISSYCCLQLTRILSQLNECFYFICCVQDSHIALLTSGRVNYSKAPYQYQGNQYQGTPNYEHPDTSLYSNMQVRVQTFCHTL